MDSVFHEGLGGHEDLAPALEKLVIKPKRLGTDTQRSCLCPLTRGLSAMWG